MDMVRENGVGEESAGWEEGEDLGYCPSCIIRSCLLIE
jgi:hypothetical protein